MKVVIDTNCLIPSIPRGNPEYWLYEAFSSQKFDWVINNEVLLEYEEMLTIFYSERTANLVSSILMTATNVLQEEPFYKWNLITKDPDDNKFADLAIAANVNYLVTNDRHFNVLKNLPFPTVKVVTLKEFKTIIYPL
ncbi:MAG: putative toxin-antitoxin system toxin component, PIN family [Bacteroidota bacterium]